MTAGFAGADLSNMVNEAAIMAARAGRRTILAEDLDEGLLRVGRRPAASADRRIAEGELEVIAWHEAGHALAAELCPTHQKAQRVTILARGDAGGLALYGNQDRALTSQQHMHERMVVAMAGRAAEQIRFGIISSGAANDLEQVSKMAREAVERLGFSPRVGQIVSTVGPAPDPAVGRDPPDDRRGDLTHGRRGLRGRGRPADRPPRGARRPRRGSCSSASRSTAPTSRRSSSSLPAGGRRLPARADALPTSRQPVATPLPRRLPAPEPIAAVADEDAPRRRRLRGVHVPRGRRVRTGVEAAAATVYAMTLTRRRRGRRKPAL